MSARLKPWLRKALLAWRIPKPHLAAGFVVGIFLSLLLLPASAQPDSAAVGKSLSPATTNEFVSARLTGKVTDSAGKPVVGAKILVNNTGGAWTDGRVPVSLTGQDGRYELPLRFTKGKTLLVRQVFADAIGYVRGASPTEFPLNGDETRDLSFVLQKGDVFAGVVRVPLTDLDSDRDPTFEKGIELLRRRVAKSNALKD